MPARTLLGLSYSKPHILMQHVLLFEGYLRVKCMFGLGVNVVVTAIPVRKERRVIVVDYIIECLRRCRTLLEVSLLNVPPKRRHNAFKTAFSSSC